MKKQFCVLLGAVVLSSGAFAQQMYATVGFGQGNTNVDCSGAPICDRSGNAFRIMGGYKFAPNMAGELGYMSFGKAKAGTPVDLVALQNSGFGGGIAFVGDLSPTWAATARAGLLMMKTKFSLGASSASDSNPQIYAGVSLGYKVSKDMSIDGYLDISNGKYDKNGFNEKGNLRAIGIGVTFGF